MGTDPNDNGPSGEDGGAGGLVEDEIDESGRTGGGIAIPPPPGNYTKTEEIGLMPGPGPISFSISVIIAALLFYTVERKRRKKTV